ncbi:MAG: DNA methyltransferase, partial [Anaerovoracaceae bacterium]|nr:DNA methyltransferase [Anaerovoracaceae bacterium]
MIGTARFDEIGEAFREGYRQYEEALSSVDGGKFQVSEEYGGAAENRIAVGDNLRYMAYLLREGAMEGKIQLIYVDPPFFSNSKYEASLRLCSEKLGTSKVLKVGAYDDRKKSGLAGYLAMLTARFFMMRDLLSKSGCLWVHLDWHVVHYVKVILDGIFGEENFINEIIWTYKSGGSSKKSFARKHDNLLVYAGGEKYKFRPLKEKSYNREMKPYRFKGVEEFRDENGWYTMVNMKDV